MGQNTNTNTMGKKSYSYVSFCEFRWTKTEPRWTSENEKTVFQDARFSKRALWKIYVHFLTIKDYFLWLNICKEGKSYAHNKTAKLLAKAIWTHTITHFVY